MYLARNKYNTNIKSFTLLSTISVRKPLSLEIPQQIPQNSDHAEIFTQNSQERCAGAVKILSQELKK